MAEAAEGRDLVIWCNEDLPLILPEVVRSLADIDADTPLQGDDLLLETLLTSAGLHELRTRLADLPVDAIAARRDITADILQRHARPARIDQEIVLPGWSEDVVDYLTDVYEDDLARVAAIPGVTLIIP